MNKKLRYAIFALVLALIALLPAIALAANSEGVITGNGVNFRTGPATSYSSIGKFYKGDTVVVTGESNGWYAVTSGGKNGYVYAAYVSIKSDADDKPATDSSAMSIGSTGAAVKQLQGNLIMLGYLNDRADGIFGSKTQSAVKLYQQKNGLSATGQADQKTNSAIQKEVLTILKVVDTAKKYLGTAYVYGGSSPSTGFDCSGLTQYSFAQAGVSIPRVSYEQAASGKSVPRSQIRVGDLVAFNSPVSHVGIYIGDGKFIHSSHTGDVVKITSLSAMNLTAIRRFTGVLAG